jgi:hypothetical protein
MRTFDKEEKMRQLLLEFKKYDKLHDNFIRDFANEIFNFIAENPKSIKLYDDFSFDIKAFSKSIINCAYEVLEKDTAFNSHRMRHQLVNIKALLAHYPVPIKNEEFTNFFIYIAKEKMTEYFPALYDLSADGFRLLACCTDVRINAFLHHFYKN